MDASISVSVIIPCYNYGHLLADAIGSVLAQTRPPDEVIVVDDGSTDKTTEVAASYGNRVQYIRQERSGPGAARNAGIRAARGELLAFLDADDWWLPHRLSSQVPIISANDEIAMVHSAFLGYHGPDVQSPVYRFSQEDCDVHVLKRSCRVGTLTVLIRKEIVDELGGFDTRLRRCQDWDLWIRVARDHRIVYHDEPVAVYRSHPDQVRSDYLLRYRFSRLVVRRYRRIHPNCAQCEQAYFEGIRRERTLLREGARALLCASRASCEQGLYRKAARSLVHALRCDPATIYSRVAWHTAAVILKRAMVGPPSQ